MIPREYVDPNNTRTFNRRRHLDYYRGSWRGAVPGGNWWCGARARLVDGRRCCAGERAARAWWSTWRAPRTRAWWTASVRSLRPGSDFDLPAALAEPPAGDARSETDRRQADGRRRPLRIRIRVEGARPARRPKKWTWTSWARSDIRVIDMKQSEKGGTFVVNTTKATDPAAYDLYINGMSEDGRRRGNDRFAADCIRSDRREHP